MSIQLLHFDREEASALALALDDAGLSVGELPDDGGVAERTLSDVVIIGPSDTGSRAVEACRQLRATGFLGAVVVVSAGDPATDGVACLEHGADDFVARPFDTQELVARIRAVLRRVNGYSRVERGPLALDRSERVAYLREQSLALTAREYSLLARLVEANGDTVTRAELLAAVWRRGGEPVSNLVEVNLSRLRDKLGSDATMIETVRRGGYRLRPR